MLLSVTSNLIVIPVLSFDLSFAILILFASGCYQTDFQLNQGRHIHYLDILKLNAYDKRFQIFQEVSESLFIIGTSVLPEEELSVLVFACKNSPLLLVQADKDVIVINIRITVFSH